MTIVDSGTSLELAAGFPNVRVRNLGQSTGGYDIDLDGNSQNKQIPGGATQTTQIYGNPVTIHNTGTTQLDVAGVGQALQATEKKSMLTHKPAPMNAFASAVTQTQFFVTNNTAGALANQKILVFLTPLMNSANYLYAAWQQLAPSDGATSKFILNQDIAAYLVTDDTTSAPVAIAPGYMSQAVNAGGLSPYLASPTPSSSVTAQQSGVQNQTSPYVGVNVAWTVNKNLVIQTASPLSAGAVSAFELQTKLYWAVGNTTSGANYTLNQITPMQTYSVPAGVATVNVSLTFDRSTGQYNFAFQNG